MKIAKIALVFLFFSFFSVGGLADGLQKFDLDRITECLNSSDARVYSEYESCAFEALEKCQEIEKYRYDQCLYIANDSWDHIIESALKKGCAKSADLCKKVDIAPASYLNSIARICGLNVDSKGAEYMQRIEIFSCRLSHLILHAENARNFVRFYSLDR